MKKIIQDIFITLLYLTPIGYVLRLFSLQKGDITPGFLVQLSTHAPVSVVVKNNPTTQERFHWFINGIVLLAQAFFIVSNNFGEELGGTYAFVAIIFALGSIISAVHPKLDWNRRINNALLLFIIIFALLFVTVFLDVRSYLI